MRVCGIAGFLLFELKSAESVENAGVSGVTRGGTLFAKKQFGFPRFRAVASFHQPVLEEVLSSYLDKGVSFWGAFWEKTLQTREKFSAESRHIHL